MYQKHKFKGSLLPKYNKDNLKNLSILLMILIVNIVWNTVNLSKMKMIWKMFYFLMIRIIDQHNHKMFKEDLV